MGATFGGSSQTVFGSDGPLPLMNKVTTGAAIVFMVTSIALAYLSAHMSTNSVMKDVAAPKAVPAAIERAPATEVEQPDVKLGTDGQAPAPEQVKENVESAVTEPAEVSAPENVPAPSAVAEKAVEETGKNTEAVSKTADKVEDKQPAASEFEKQLATEQEKAAAPEKKE